MSEKVYRVVYANGTPRRTGGYQGRQHVYPKRHTAQSVVTQHNNKNPKNPVKMQETEVEWRDCE